LFLYGRSYASGHFVASFNYRRWPTKAALVLAMSHERMAVHPEYGRSHYPSLYYTGRGVCAASRAAAWAEGGGMKATISS
jgi:hypothetical protein